MIVRWLLRPLQHLMQSLENQLFSRQRSNFIVSNLCERDQFFREERSRHGFHTILFQSSGKSVQEVDFDTYELSSNHILIIPKGSIYLCKEITAVSGYAISFKEDFFSKVQKELLDAFLQYAFALHKLSQEISIKDIPALKLYFEILALEQDNEENQNHTFLLQNLMLALINKLEGVIQESADSNNFLTIRRPFQRFIKSVEDNFIAQKGVEYYSSELDINKRKLNEIVKKTTGFTVSEFIIDKTLSEAKRELSFGEKSIKEIAFTLGYESQYYFSRLFKQKTGLSPEGFRTKYAE